MEDYETLLKKVMEKIPKSISNADRFKVPEIICETQGNKTVIKNFVEIIGVIRRDADHLSKFLFKELATPGTVQGNFLILQTKLSRDILKRKLDDYLKNYVYCKVCGEPDTRFVKEGRLHFIVCEACGAKNPLKSM